MIPKNCPECGAEIKEKKGISKKTGQPYHFFGCSNFAGGCKYIVPREETGIQDQLGGNKEVLGAILLAKDEILDALRKVYTRIEDVGK